MQNNAGGEIYVNELTQINAMLYQVLSTIIDNIHNTTPVDFKNFNISPQLTDNTGPLGNTIYGSTLGEHKWLNPNSHDADVLTKCEISLILHFKQMLSIQRFLLYLQI